MPGLIDYARLRDQTLQSTEDDDPVTVNTRALVDKILARYSGEWTTLRELIQNAADASAHTVKIKFETQPSATVPATQSTDDVEQLKHVFLHHTVRSLIVTNDGLPFSTADWSRLKRIAEGNPDETKIGAFGVGFYSVFADCENPFITSGRESMAFYWKRDSLFTRKGTLPPEHPSTETTFMLEFRNKTSPIPSLLSLCQFLSTSITFVAIEMLELWVDDYNLFTLKKKSAPSVTQPLPKDIDPRTKEGLMRISGLDWQNSQIDATWVNIVGWTPTSSTPAASIPESESQTGPSLRTFFSRLAAGGVAQSNAAARKAAKDEQAIQRAIAEDLLGISKATVFIKVTQVHIKTQVNSSFATELERATKKQPPKQTKLAILTSSYDETNASLSTLTGAASKKVADIITSILPSKNGKIFIGFPTAQTTGLGAHISASNLIPTVEREQVDLNARFVRTWNTELLSVAGIAARIAYSASLPRSHSKELFDPSQLAASYPSSIFTLKQFTFRESTPLGRIGTIIEEAFWSCSKLPIEIPSTRGILPSNEVRMASEDLSFVNRIPLVPEEVNKDAHEFVSKVRDFGLVTDITTSDIRAELEKQALTETQLGEFLKWAARKTKSGDMDSAAIQSLITVTIANLDAPAYPSASSNLLELRSIDAFVSNSRIPSDLPVPPSVMPFRFTKNLQQPEMQNFGWTELQIVPWLRWLLDRAGNRATPTEENPSTSPAFAGQVLAVISKGWDPLSPSSKTTVTELLTSRTVIPTKMGMKKPTDAYFSSVKLFDDLPTISGLNNVKEKFLKALGVRKTVELSFIFERLMNPSASGATGSTSWSHVDLIRYFQSVWNDIPPEDIAQLQKMALCPSEEESEKTSKKYFKVSELFEPKDALRALGLPILQWPGHWNAFSSEGKILKVLGLRSNPSAQELVDIMLKANKSGNDKRYEDVLKYFIENHYTHNYASAKLADFSAPFLPLQNGEPRQLVKPADCFADTKAEVLQYPILRQDLRQHATKFGVAEQPPIADCAARLLKQPPQNQRDARKLFSYFADRLTDITPVVTERLGSALIVPIPAPRSDHTARRLVAPSQCFLGDGQEYGDIFDYVDFGAEANMFLLKIGSKHEPSITELAQLVIKEPKRIFKALKVDKYKSLLYKFHINLQTLKKNKILWKDMKTSTFLIAVKEQPVTTSGTANGLSSEDDPTDERLDTNQTVQEYHLRSAEHVCILDDLILYTIFKAHVLTAPTEELLEELYYSLGSPLLSSLIDEEARFGPKTSDQQNANVLRELILERSQLFLHEQPPGSIRHDSKWLEKNMDIQIVSSISLRRTLRGKNVSDVEKRSAALKTDSSKHATLSITAQYDVWQVAQCVVNLLIDRPKTQVTMVFETFLVTPLLKLRSRGYNVDRILRKQANERARVAETERQRQQQDEERRKQQQQQDRKNQDEAPSSPDKKRAKALLPSSPAGAKDEEDPPPYNELAMPGAFQDSPVRATQPAQPQRVNTPRGLLSSITKRFGFDQQQTVQQMHAQYQTTPTPDSTYRPQQPHNEPNTEAVTSPEQVMSNLRSAASSTRAYGSNTLFSPPQTNLVKEIQSYCDTRPGHDLQLLGTISTGLRVYLSSEPNSTSAAPAARASFLTNNAQGLEYFSSILLAAASVFPVAKDSLHIYYDDSGTTIAFNSGGSIFCNYRYFAQLHLAGMQDVETRGQALIYWWVTMCHELAHNLVADHSQGHSYWTESFVMNYFPKVTALMGRLAEATR